MDLGSFQMMRFPDNGNIIYVILFARKGEPQGVPIYVGESTKHVGRLGDYVSAKFSASTDFRVGEAIRYLQSLGYDVLMRYRESHNRRVEERDLINSLRGSFRLLNDMESYKYKFADEEQERSKIHAFIELLLCASPPYLM
ncbi:hypothetical protein C2U69_27670 [Cupriavidus pinatubonensis]|nr:hypothetical protein C2U69_27670 [Cupriavidus pinatubonensis]